MSSPVNLSFHSFVQINHRKLEVIYLQNGYQCINAVKNIILEENSQLPDSRIIAENLQLHRKTVVSTLTELQDQSWVEIIPNIGTFVGNPTLIRHRLRAQKLSNTHLKRLLFILGKNLF